MSKSLVKINFWKKVISGLMAFIFATGSVVTSYAQTVPMSAPGTMVSLSASFAPPLLKGVKVYADNPFRLDFILDKGDMLVGADLVSARQSNDYLKTESTRLIKYFLASITVPEKDLWVNLSPYEKDRIVPDAFGITEMGRDLLAQDYMLKQITASVIYPEGEIGNAFWAKVYAEAQKRYGTSDVPVDTFNKVWIVPEKAVVYESKDSAYVVESRLKVMLEEDYLALEKNTVVQDQSAPATNKLGSDIVREVVIPILEKEVNEGKNFAQLRQVYHSLILAVWYKDKVKESIFGKAYVDQKKTGGVDIEDKAEKEKIWAQYVDAFKKGAYNYIKEDLDPATQQPVPRKYFSGGNDLTGAREATERRPANQLRHDYPELAMALKGTDMAMLQVKLDAVMTVRRTGDAASITNERASLITGKVLSILRSGYLNPRALQKEDRSIFMGADKTLSEEHWKDPEFVVADFSGLKTEAVEKRIFDFVLGAPQRSPIEILAELDDPFVSRQRGVSPEEMEMRLASGMLVLMKTEDRIMDLQRRASMKRFLPGVDIMGFPSFRPENIDAIFVSKEIFEIISTGLSPEWRKRIIVVDKNIRPADSDKPYPVHEVQELTIPDYYAAIRDYLIQKGEDLTRYTWLLRGDRFPTFFQVQRESSAAVAGVEGATPGEKLEAATKKGGIDLTRDKMDIQVQSGGQGVQFKFDSSMIRQLQNASGLTPVIIDIQPMTTTLPMFLGLKNDAPVAGGS